MLKFGIPKGSLEEKTLSLLNSVGYNINFLPRKYTFTSYDNIQFHLCKPFEIAQLVHDNILDAGICGYDSLIELDLLNKVDITKRLNYSKKTNRTALYVIAVPESSKIRKIEQLEGLTIATERVNILKKFLEEKNINANITKSLGATEIKPSYDMCDAICDITETGESLKANNLRIISKVLETYTVIIHSKNISIENFEKLKNFENILSTYRSNMMCTILIGEPGPKFYSELKEMGFVVKENYVLCNKSKLPLLYEKINDVVWFVTYPITNTNIGD